MKRGIEVSRIAIAIDGPAGAGKSTIAKIISHKLGILYLDTGAMYRAVALKAINEGIGSRDREKLSVLVSEINIRIVYENGEQKIILDGVDISDKIRTPEVSMGASDVAAIPEVRIKMVQLQREMAKETDVVMDGRDIGTYVLPDAPYKFFLTASAEERARRRFLEMQQKGLNNVSFEEVKNDMKCRDNNDSSREFAPLKKAEDAIEIDTTNMTIEKVAEKILSCIK